MIIDRDYRLTESDDFIINIQPHIGYSQEAVPVYDEKIDKIIGWSIKTKYE